MRIKESVYAAYVNGTLINTSTVFYGKLFSSRRREILNKLCMSNKLTAKCLSFFCSGGGWGGGVQITLA